MCMKSEYSRIFPVYLATLQPLQGSRGGGQKQAWQRKEQRGAPPSLNLSHLRAHTFPLRVPSLQTGSLRVKSQGSFNKETNFVPHLILLPWSSFNSSGMGGPPNRSFLGSVDKLEELKREAGVIWNFFLLPWVF